MKKITFTFTIFLLFCIQSFGQINPATNLTWNWHYNFGNYFDLHWDAPATPHSELIGYNIYRENDLYRFQTGNNLYYLEQGSNCPSDFQDFNNGLGFYAHVTAVYNPEQVESTYTETIYINPGALQIDEFIGQKTILYPNPTNGILNVENQNLNKILIFDFSGKKVKELEPKSQIDLSDIPKGIYIVKLISDNEVMINKILIE